MAELESIFEKTKARTLLRVPVWSSGKNALLANVLNGAGLTAIHSANAEILIQARSSPELRQALEKNPTNIADGFWVARACGLKFSITVERIAGSDLFWDLCELAQQQRWRVFFLGSTPGVLSSATAIVNARFPQLEIASLAPPIYKGQVMPKPLAEAIRASLIEFRPQVLVVCLGAPKQEQWIDSNSEWLRSIGVRAALSAGGTLDFVAGKSRRAPVFLQQIGLEWAYRLCVEPWRLRRQLTRLPIFTILATADIIRYKLRSQK